MKQTHDEFEDPTPATPIMTHPKQTQGNPLSKYFRLPSIHVKLPSQGKFMPPGSVELTMSGEVPIYPMRAADEILLRSPDALLNGYAIEKLIESCVPAIKNPRLISNADLDVLLLAIRSASYGEIMKIDVKCPKCEETSEVGIDISLILAHIVLLEPEYTIRLSDQVMVFIRPFNLVNATQAAMTAFEETKKIQILPEDLDQAARSHEINVSYDRLAKLNLDLIADCIMKVVVPEGQIVDHSQILEFVNNVDRRWVKQIDDTLKGMNRTIDRHQMVECSSCQHQWDTEVEFDPASFFELRS